MKYIFIIGCIIGVICVINANNTISSTNDSTSLMQFEEKEKVITDDKIGSDKVITNNKKVENNSPERNFINKVGEISTKYYPKYKILPSITIAQAIIESGWGKSQLSKKYHNYFGIKGHGYKNCVNFKTKEEVGGKMIVISSDFRKYNSLEESIKNYNEFLTKENTIYIKNGILSKIDYKSQANILQKTGYATDSKYAIKIIQMIEKHKLYQFDKK